MIAYNNTRIQYAVVDDVGFTPTTSGTVVGRVFKLIKWMYPVVDQDQTFGLQGFSSISSWQSIHINLSLACSSNTVNPVRRFVSALKIRPHLWQIKVVSAITRSF